MKAEVVSPVKHGLGGNRNITRAKESNIRELIKTKTNTADPHNEPESTEERAF